MLGGAMPGGLHRFACIPLLAAALEAQDGAAAAASEYRREHVRALPHGFGLWGLLEKLEPGAAAEPMDFGGLTGARLPLYAAGAASWTRTRYRLNHLDGTDPYMPGRAIFFPGLESVESSGVAGEVVQLATRRSQPRWRGRLSSHLTGSALAWRNLPSLAERAGLLRSEKFRWYTRDHIEFGGGLGRRADVFFSGTGQWASQSVPREPVRDRLNTRLLIGTASGTVRLGKRDRLRAAFTGSRIDLSGFGMPVGFEALAGRRMAPPLEAHPDQREEDHLDSVQGGWVREAGRSNWEVRYGYGIAHLDTATPPWSHEVRIDLLDGSASGAPPLANLGVRTRHELEALWRAEELSGGETRVAAGVNWQRAAFRNRLTIPGDRHLILVNGQPSSLVEFNTPLDSRGRVSLVRLSAAGGLELAPWISLSAGLAVDLARGSIPPQSSPAGAFAAERLFRDGRAAIVWNDWAPWAGILLAPPVPGNLRFTGHYRRGLQPLAGRYLDFANPNSVSGQEYRWPDRTLLRRFGGEYSAVDPTLRRPYVDEFAASIEAILPGSIEGGLRLFRRDDRRRMAAINQGVPFEASELLISQISV
jgi:hypothetical protein